MVNDVVMSQTEAVRPSGSALDQIYMDELHIECNYMHTDILFQSKISPIQIYAYINICIVYPYTNYL